MSGRALWQKYIGIPEGHRSIFDFLRVISCIGIIGLHVTGDRTDTLGLFFEQCFRISLPMFFLLSGVLILTSEKELKIGAFYLNRFEKIGIPMIIYAFYYSCWINLGHPILELPTAQSAAAFVGLMPSAISWNLAGPQYFHTWFLYEIVGIYLVMPFVKKGLNAMSDGYLKALAAVILVMMSCTDYLTAFGQGFYISNYFAFWIIYPIFGYMLMQEFSKRHYRGIAVFGAVFFAGAFLAKVLFPGFTGRIANYYDLAPHMIFTVCGAFALVMLLEKPLTRFRWWNVVMKRLSRYTFGIYLIHGYIISWWSVHQGTSNGTVFGTIRSIAGVFLLSLLFTLVFDNLITFPLEKLFHFCVHRREKNKLH